MTQPRRIMPLPLGGEHGLPYSRGLMARALMAVGVPPDRAYTLARRVGIDIAMRDTQVVELGRLEALAVEAGRALPASDDPLVAGFLEQSRNVLVGVQASIERALQEGWSMVLEGVHLVPGLLPVIESGAAVSACVLKICDETAHAQHFFARDAGTERPMAKYLDRFGEIRQLQDFIVGRAERERIPVIENESADAATAAVAELVLSAAERVGGRV
jgi:2-phosphoglycerate kinase